MASIYMHLGNFVHYDPSRINAPWIRLLNLFLIPSQKFDNRIFGLRPQSINTSKHVTQMSVTSLLFSYFVRYLCATKPIEFLSFYYLCSHILFFSFSLPFPNTFQSQKLNTKFAKIDYEYWTTTPKYKLIIKICAITGGQLDTIEPAGVNRDTNSPGNQRQVILIEFRFYDFQNEILILIRKLDFTETKGVNIVFVNYRCWVYFINTIIESHRIYSYAKL